MRQLQTSRLNLEPQLASHAEEMFAVLSDPAIYEYENAPPPSVEWLKNRFEKLESRQSPEASEQWLNWVIRLEANELIGFVQATVDAAGAAFIAYELASAYWGRGLASEAVGAMMAELASSHHVRLCLATLKAKNARSLRLLERLGFLPADADRRAEYEVESDEVLMQRRLVA